MQEIVESVKEKGFKAKEKSKELKKYKWLNKEKTKEIMSLKDEIKLLQGHADPEVLMKIDYLIHRQQSEK